MIDYEIVKIVWWVLVVVLLIGFAIMDGHDMGVGTLLTWVGRSDDERRVIVNTIGPHWDGNQVWFITAGGAIFAAWPLVLWALFFRPVGFEYRSKVADPTWRSVWDWCLFIGGAVPSLVFGVAIGNVITGVPFHFEDSMMPVYTGSFWQLFTPFTLVCGLASLSMLVFHGGNYLQLRTEGEIAERSRKASQISGIALLVLFTVGGLMLSGVQGYTITSAVNPAESVSPVGKTVEMAAGAWLNGYRAHPLLWAIPAVAYLGLGLSLLTGSARRPGLAFIGSGLTCAGVILTAGSAIFPFVLPSSSNPSHSLTVWDCVSSQLTLHIMFWVALVMTPIVLSYTSWAYRLMRGKVTVEAIAANGKGLY